MALHLGRRLRRTRDWRDPFQWFEWYFMATASSVDRQRLAEDGVVRLAQDGTLRVSE